MFGKIFEWIRVNILRQEGRIQENIDAQYEDPYVADRAFEKAIAGDSNAFRIFRDAVANQMALNTQLKQQYKTLSAELEAMHEDLEAAKVAAQEIVAELQKKGMASEQIQEDQKFLEAQGFYQDTASKIPEREARLADLEARIGGLDDKIKNAKLQMQQLQRSLEQKKQERQETKQDMVMDKQLQQAADMIAGVDVDGYNADLQRARDARARLRGRAQLAQEVSGMDAQAQRAGFREKLNKSKASTEFANLVGLTKATVAKEDAAKAPAEKPEAGSGVLN
jgi:DNA repair exonuclease SbcCD ATPase subunit